MWKLFGYVPEITFWVYTVLFLWLTGKAVYVYFSVGLSTLAQWLVPPLLVIGMAGSVFLALLMRQTRRRLL